MTKSQIDARTFGVGELITQRKLFFVPEHQRNFSWGLEQIEQFLVDVSSALAKASSDYFVGLAVLQGPLDGAWHILDGQQRIATSTMIYSAIRHWLAEFGFSADARQIETEYIGVRQLGGEYHPRLRLNTDNRSVFEKYVTSPQPTAALKSALKSYSAKSSNYRLLEGAISCREWIQLFAGENREVGAAKLFALANYLENGVKIVCVDVPNAADAYVLFESLNDRGADLSALDLVKNYIFSQLGRDIDDSTRYNWQLMTNNIEDSDADNFLKVFWTSRFGIVPRTQLFTRIRNTYSDARATRMLVRDLADASMVYQALEDPEHEYWTQLPPACRQYVRDLNTLGSRQSRPLILGALRTFTPSNLAAFLWLLIVAIVRFQLIGRGRTGVMEKAFAVLAKQIHAGEVCDSKGARKALSSLETSDVEFEEAFRGHVEHKSARVHLLLSELEALHRFEKGLLNPLDYLAFRASAVQFSPEFILEKRDYSFVERVEEGRAFDDTIFSVGNRVLIEEPLARELKTLRGPDRTRLCFESSIFLTKEAYHPDGWARDDLSERCRKLAHQAVKAWNYDEAHYKMV